ncbi:MAG: uroporphyrinogen decarboxylase [Mycobacteriales bacterium]
MNSLLAAARREAVSQTPVWFMRQAGRSLPEYHTARAGMPMLRACQTPDLVTEITLQPVRRHKVDAAIFFSDIVVPLRAIGVDVEIQPGVGPVISSPIRREADLSILRPLHAEDVPYISEAVTALVTELGDTPLIGFTGAPFTLASYLIEGGPSKHHAATKALMHGEEKLWHALCERLAGIAAEFLRVQVAAGASVVQLFDSWAGVLSEAEYVHFVQPHSARVLQACGELGVPRIHFGVGTGELLPAMAQAGADVIGVDWRVPLGVASQRVGPRHAVQGNLDPAVLLAPETVVEREVRRVLTQGRAAPGHIFNLGHGVLPQTDPGMLTRVVELVHSYSSADTEDPSVH